MKTLKKVQYRLERVEQIPDKSAMLAGVIYYSEQYGTTNHLCPCGCGAETPLSLLSDDPNSCSMIVDSRQRVTIVPSIYHANGCRSHYVMSDGQVNILEDSPEQENKTTEQATQSDSRTGTADNAR